MDVVIAMGVSPKTTHDVLSRAIQSIMDNIGTQKYLIIVLMPPELNQKIREYVYRVNETYRITHVLPEENKYWADFMNESIALASSKEAKYFIECHDDIQLTTKDFMPKMEKRLSKISKKKKIGWISITDKEYMMNPTHFVTSTRPGHHKDFIFENAYGSHKMFQFHSGEWNTKLGYPKRPVKCHSPFSHFTMIETEVAKKFKCVNWEIVGPLLSDEDWGLQMLQNGYSNIWVPDIEYVHFRQGISCRGTGFIQDHQDEIHKKFYEKWNFHLIPTKEELEFIKKEYKGTKIPWSMKRRSYEWDYI